jgi:hypothetical protein
MGTEKYTGVSEELARTFPHLRFLPACYFGSTECVLRKGSDKTCMQMKDVKGMTMSDPPPSSNKHRELIDMRPMPPGCKDCPLNKA